jgi:hypothetical protein
MGMPMISCFWQVSPAGQAAPSHLWRQTRLTQVCVEAQAMSPSGQESPVTPAPKQTPESTLQ